MRIEVQYGWSSDEERESVIQQYRHWLETHPDDPGTRYMLGNCLFNSGRKEEGQAEWDKVLALNNGWWTAAIAKSAKIVYGDQS